MRSPAGVNMSPPLPAAVIGHRFAKEYYSLLSKSPVELYKLYKAESVFSHGQEGAGADAVSFAVGPEDIHGVIMASVGSFNGHACRAEILGIESQESHHGGVLVLITGYLTCTFNPSSPGQERRHFSQTVFLGKQSEPEDGYFVLNDILRYSPVESAPSRLPPQQEVLSHQPFVPSRPPPQQPPAETVPLANPGAVQASLQPQFAAQAITGREEELHRQGECHDGIEAAEENDETTADEELAREGHEEAANASQPHHDKCEDLKTDEPKTWASMAEKLRQGGGQLAPPSRGRGLGLPPMPKSGRPVLPPPSSVMAKVEAAVAPVSIDTAGLLPPAQSVLPAAATPENVKGVAVCASTPGGSVRMWMSRIQADRLVLDEELIECINQSIVEGGGTGRAEKIEYTDQSREHAYLFVSSAETADVVVRQSKGRKIRLQGKGFKVEYDQKAQDHAPRGSAKGDDSGKWGKGAGRHENSEAAPSNGADWNETEKETRPSKKGGKGGKGNGEKGAAGQSYNADVGSDGHSGGGKGRRTGGKGFNGGWRGNKDG